MRGRNWIIPFVIVLLIVYVIIFMLPDNVDKFALIPGTIKAGEWWRMLTYQFTHLNITHLVENMAGLTLAGLIAFEVSAKFKEFSLTYLSAGSLAVLPLWLKYPFIALGASAAIFGIFGFIALAAKKIDIQPWWIVLLFLLVILGDAFFNFEQGMAHLSGFIFGIGMFIVLGHIKEMYIKRKSMCLRSM